MILETPLKVPQRLNRSLLIVLFLFSLLGMWSCQDKIDIDLPEGETFLVVEGWITNEPGPQIVKLSYTAAYFSDKPLPTVTGAHVTIEDDEGNLTPLVENTPGIYHYPDSGIIGRAYRLNISIPGGDVYRSDFELLREPVLIDSIAWQVSDKTPNPEFDENPDDIYDVVIFTQEPPSPGDYYQWRSILNGVEQRAPSDIFTSDDALVNGSIIPFFNVTEELYSASDTVTIIQEHISQAAYEFLTQVQAQTAFVGSPFDTPPAPIAGNVHNLTNLDRDALGFFGAAGRDRATVIVGE